LVGTAKKKWAGGGKPLARRLRRPRKTNPSLRSRENQTKKAAWGEAEDPPQPPLDTPPQSNKKKKRRGRDIIAAPTADLMAGRGKDCKGDKRPPACDCPKGRGKKPTTNSKQM